MIDYSNCELEQLAVHQVGNKMNEEALHLSEAPMDISDIELRERLLRYFLQPFSEPKEFFNLSAEGEDFTLNPVFNAAAQVFDEVASLQQNSIELAQYLYELAEQPQIKSGDLFVVYFTEIVLEDEVTEAVGIFKAENRHSFLKLNQAESNFSLGYEEGIYIEKLDKGCLIFNTDREVGFKVCIVDKSTKAAEAQYWKAQFLDVKPASDTYHYTKQFLTSTKNFVTQQLAEEFPVSKADQIDLLNRSVSYFKSHESFDKEEFEEEVLQKEEVIESFRNHNEAYQQEHDIDFGDRFDISPQAVKQQSRVFKSVLKLDKNFHIYIHGDRELIEQGVEVDGRKYYKIYFDKEE